MTFIIHYSFIRWLSERKKKQNCSRLQCHHRGPEGWSRLFGAKEPLTKIMSFFQSTWLANVLAELHSTNQSPCYILEWGYEWERSKLVVLCGAVKSEREESEEGVRHTWLGFPELLQNSTLSNRSPFSPLFALFEYRMSRWATTSNENLGSDLWGSCFANTFLVATCVGCKGNSGLFLS